MEASTQREAGPDVDWEEIERSPEFQELVTQAQALRAAGDDLLPGLVHGLHPARRLRARTSWSRRVYEGLTVGYCLALTQFVMVLVLGLLYLRKADREFDPLAAKASTATRGSASGSTARRAPRSPTAASTAEVER